MKLPEIETDNCTIKLLEINQAQLMCEYYQRNKDYLKAWEPDRNAEFYTIEHWQKQVRESLNLFELKQAFKFVALNKSQTSVIASCNYSNIVWGSFLACHMGYSIDQEYAGTGVMYEIAQATINYMKDEVKLHRIMANHMPHNVKSANLLKRLGFEKEGFAKNYLYINGKWQDHILNALVLS